MARKPSTLESTIGEGERRASLEAIRGKLARELAEAYGKDAATLAKELREVIRELDSLPTGGEESPVDEIAARRARRLANAASQ